MIRKDAETPHEFVIFEILLCIVTSADSSAQGVVNGK
jgi:hypothetical protein